ncbi:MAG: xanthine dehydrogenase family protein molybdopterin-binding subunit [Planctomycetota bacterium]|jgi:isoquinoline 1-oxidoreductase
MRNDEYLELDFSDVSDPFPTDRREFLKVLGGGIFVFVTLADAELLAQRRRGGFGRRTPADFNAFLKIGEDGKVSCFTGKIEMGQGIVTSLAQMLADELDVSLPSVEMVMGDTDLCPWDMGTFGSMTTRFFGPPLRAAAAEARAVLMELAAERLKVPVGRLVVKDGVISDRQRGGKRVSYAELTKGKKIQRRLDGKAVLESVSDFTTVGKPVLRMDAHDKVTGKAKYAGDVRLPGMLYAKILRPPAHGATLKSVDTSEAEKLEGVRIAKEGDLVAVLHERPDVAEAALAKVKAQFVRPEADVDDRTIFDHLLKVAPEGRAASRGGDLKEGEKLAADLSEGTYLNSYVAHAPIEPHTAVAKIEGGKATVWASTQTPFGARDEAARALGLSSQNVRVITPFVGGGFGGKTRNQQVVEAALLAKSAGRPVQVAWSRAEEFFYDTFRPAAVVKIRSGVDRAGRLVLWDYHVYFAGNRGSQHFYDVPHHATVAHGSGWRGSPGSHPFGTGAWRAPANNTNTHARESQIDVMAAKIGADPVQFRLKNLKDERMLRVVKAAAKKFGWTPKKAPSGRGFGVACGIDSGTYVTLMAEVEVDKGQGTIQVKRVVCAQDMGLVINPQGAKIQIEGCITMGLGYALTEEIHFKGGEIFDLSFGTYKIPRFSWLPEIETVLIEAKDAPPQGGGEPAIIAMGAVIANAVFDATGARLLQLPMTPDRVKEAIEKSG